MKDFLIPAVIAIAVVAIGFTFFAPKVTLPPFGAAASPDHYGFEQFFGGVLNGTQIASSSAGTSVTISANEFRGWASSAAVSFTPNLPGSTLTLPASSTLSALVPHAGDTQMFCIRNATSTALTNLILAGGTGTNLLVASSSVSALGGKNLLTGKVGCMRLVREPLTTTTFDIDVLLTVFQ